MKRQQRQSSPRQRRKFKLGFAILALTAAACTCFSGVARDLEAVGDEFADLQPTFNYLATRQSSRATMTATFAGADFDATRTIEATLGTPTAEPVAAEDLLQDPTIQAFLTLQGDIAIEDGDQPDQVDLAADDIYELIVPFDCGLVPIETIGELLEIPVVDVQESRSASAVVEASSEAEDDIATTEPGNLVNLECRFELEGNRELIILNRITGSEEQAEISFATLALITGLFTGEEVQGEYAQGVFSPPNNTFFTLNGPYMVNFIAPVSGGAIQKQALYDVADEWIRVMPPAIEIVGTPTPTPSTPESADDAVQATPSATPEVDSSPEATASSQE